MNMLVGKVWLNSFQKGFEFFDVSILSKERSFESLLSLITKFRCFLYLVIPS